MSTKCSIWLKQMNLWNDSGQKWPMEPESKPEIEGKHLHYKVMANEVIYTTISNWH